MTEPVFFPVPGGPESTHPRRELAIAELFSRQKTLATLEQLDALGLTPRAVRKRAQIGRLHCVYPRVYSTTAPVLLPARARWLAAVLACAPGAYLSHRSAAALWGIRGTNRAATDVIAPGSRGRKLPGIDTHRASTLTVADVTTVDGIPCTSAARTVLDLAALVPRRAVERAIEQADVLEVFDLREFDDVLDRNPTVRGAPVVRSVLDDFQREETHLSTLTENDFEDAFLGLCDAAGLPRPEAQQYLMLPGGDVVRVDFLWRDLRVVVETDGRKFHRSYWSREQDARRDLLLTEAGWHPVRVTRRMVFIAPAETTRILGGVLTRAQAFRRAS